MGHEDRRIANNPHTMLMRIALEGSPLPEEEVLAINVRADARRQALPPGGQRRWLSRCDLRLPLHPGCPAVGVFQSHEEGKISQPRRVVGLKALHVRPL